MASYTLSPIGGAGSQFFDNSGNVLTGGKLYTYAAGTTTPQTTWTTPAGITANSNPIVLNSAGRPAQEIWLSSAYSYKFVLKDSNDVLIATYDNIPGLPQPAIANDASSISYEPNVLVTAGSFVIGQTYMIASLGTTDFTVIGAGYNSTGVIFTASGAGTGTGTAYVSTTVETRLRAYEASGGSDYIGFLQAGAGALTTETVQDKLRESVSVKDFGAVGDGSTDDSAAFQYAIDALNGAGKVFVPPGRYYLASTINIKSNVFLCGGAHNVSEDNVAHNYDSFNNTIFLNPTATINLADGATIDGFQILSNLLNGALPFANEAAALASIASWSGTAITQTGSDVKVSNCFIGGFAQAFDSNNKERTKIDWVNIDCTAGVLIKASYDIARIENVHCWPFIVAHQSPTLSNATWKRSGSAFKTLTGADATTFTNCFSYAYEIGFDIQTRTSCTIVGCYADSASYGSGQIGFKLSNGAELVNIIGGGSSGQSQAIYINVTNTTYGRININGLSMWGNYAHLVSDQHKNLNIVNCVFRDTNGGSRIAITINAGNTGITNISNNVIDLSTTAYSIDATALRSTRIWNNSIGSTTDSYGQRQLSDNNSATVSYQAYNSSASGYTVRYAKSRGSAASPSAAVISDSTGSVFGDVYNGSAFTPVGATRFTLRNTPSSTSTPGGWIASTTPSGAIAVVDRVVINENGHLYPATDNAYSCGASGQRWSEIWAANGTIQTSDKRTKTEVKDALLGLNFINALRPVSYKWVEGSNKVIRQVYLDKDGNEIPENQPIPDDATPGQIITEPVQGKRTHWGLIAQEVKEAVDAAGVDFGGWILTDKDNPDSQQALRYDQFIAPLIKAVQELSARIAELEAK